MIRRCAVCGQQNRVGAEHLHQNGRCGRCSEPLPGLDAPVDVAGVEEFDAIVAGARVPVLIDFWAAWCGPCRMAAPEVAKAARELQGKALVLKVDTEKLPELAERHHVRGIPHFAVLYRRHVASSQAGLVQARELVRRVERAVAERVA